MPEYRWNQAEMAAGYDAGAVRVHTHYVEVQDEILSRLPFQEQDDSLVVDLGGGSGRLVERILDRWPKVRAVIVDQSQPFLDLAAQRLEPHRDRVTLVRRKLQEDWREVVTRPAAAVVSMSAIHHLDPAEKRICYRRCFGVLEPDGLLMNGDEVRAEADAEYRTQVETWGARMERLIEEQAVTPAMADGLRLWQQRNVEQFGQPKSSGDDCHETAATQLTYLRDAGFTAVDAPWQRDLWTLLLGRKG